MKQVTLPAIEARQNGTSMIITKMRAGDLPTFTVVHPYTANKTPDDPEQGYQRPAETPRIKKFANWLRQESENNGKVRMPTAVLLSGRGANVQLSQNGTVTLSEASKLPLIDGQHRTRGFEYAFRDKGMTQFADYEVPVVIMNDLDKVGEMRQFSVVNGTQKSVRTDLVNMILAQLSEAEGEEAIKSSDHWKVVVSKVVTALNADQNGPWFDRIVMPDQKVYTKEEVEARPELQHRRVIRATSFMTSLKQIDAYLHEHGFADDDTLDARVRSLLQVVDAFWRAIRKLNPVVFTESANFVLQKTPGIFALHQLCLRVMKDMHIGHRKWTEDQFAEVLSNCAEIADPTYWYVGTGEEYDRGDAARYGSMKGFSELASLLYHSLRS
jgi:DGQHR domain-containing protein